MTQLTVQEVAVIGMIRGSNAGVCENTDPYPAPTTPLIMHIECATHHLP